MAEALFLIQPWAQTKSAMDYCKLCYQERNTKDHVPCKQSHLSAYNSIMAIVKIEKTPEFEEAYRELVEAHDTCVGTEKPNEHCHSLSQAALKQTHQLYDKVIEDYKKRLPSKPPHATEPKSIG